MAITKTISFPEDLHDQLRRRVQATPGAKFSPLVSALLRRALEAEGVDRREPDGRETQPARAG